MHCLQNTISQIQYPCNKESTPLVLILPHVGFEHGPLQPQFDTLPKRQSSTFETELPSVFTDFLSPFFFDSSHSSNPKAPYKTKNRKILNQHLIYRTKTSDLNVTRYQKDKSKKSTGNEERIFDWYQQFDAACAFFKKYWQPIIKFWPVLVAVHKSSYFYSQSGLQHNSCLVYI